MSFDSDLVAKATAEWESFDRDTGRGSHKVKVDGTEKDKETVEPYASRVGDFWLAVPSGDYNYLVSKYAKDKGKLDGTVTAAPWSAAFISYCMQAAGAGDAFPYSAAHSTWIIQSIKACLANKTSAPLVGYRLGTTPIALGDLIGRPRAGDAGLSYDDASISDGFTSHTDIVVEIDLPRRRAFVIGGNVGHSVSKSEVRLDANGALDDPDGWFVQIRNNIGGMEPSRRVRKRRRLIDLLAG